MAGGGLARGRTSGRTALLSKRTGATAAMTGQVIVGWRAPPCQPRVRTSARKLLHRLSHRVQRIKSSALGSWATAGIRGSWGAVPMPGGEFGSARTFACLQCHGVVLVCPHCDRGQRYCSACCRHQARRAAQRAAARRYQATPRGRLAHARRQRRYRQRGAQEIVTHQGSQGVDCGDVLASEQRETSPPGHCHWCARGVTDVVRHGFLRHATLQATLPVWLGGIVRGQSP